MREKSESERELEGVRGCWQWERARESWSGRQAERTERKRDRERELEGSNRTSKLNVEIRVECLAR